jgi:hypothetical protein
MCIFLVFQKFVTNSNLQPKSFTPVLSKLKSLNESRASLAETLKQAEEIAGLGAHTVPVKYAQTQSNSTEIYDKKSCSPSKGHARAEWALRWLLEKFKSKEKKKEALLSPDAWNLLDRLVRAIPIANAARLLNANNILSIVKESLEEAGRSFDSRSKEANLHEKANVINSAGSDSSATLDHGSPSRKRKRTPIENNRREEPSPGSELFDLINHVATFLTMISDLSQNATQQDLVSVELMKSVLRTGTPEAAQILAGWLRCLCLLLDLHQADSQHFTAIRSGLSLLMPILKIWELRAHEHDDNHGSSAATFSKLCLVPATTLYSKVTSESKFIL